MFGLTQSRAIVLGMSGVVLAGVLSPIASRVIAQVPPPPINPIQSTPTDVTPGVTPGLIIPTPTPIPVRPSVLTPRTPAASPIRRQIRRIPIGPVPMPGDRPTTLPPLPATPDLRTMPGSAASITSGVAGRITLTPICSVTAPIASCAARPYVGPFRISTAARDRVLRLYAGEGGTFQLRLAPGQYVIEPDGTNFPIGTRQTFTVISSVTRQMEFNFQGTPTTAATPLP